MAIHLRQVQDEEPFPISVPVAVTVAGRSEALWAEAGSCGRDCIIEVPCPARPLRIDVDPAFDVMRRLDPLEVPPALSTVFGAPDPLYVLPAAAPPEELAAWRQLAADWARPAAPRVVLDSELEELPAAAAWVLGWGNRFGPGIAARLAEQGVALGVDGLRLPAETLPRAELSVVFVARAEGDPAAAVGWVAGGTAAVPGLARKLPHYTRYSYLGFRGPEPENVAKGMWQPLSSPLVRGLGEGPLPELVLPARAPLSELPPAHDVAQLAAVVAALADPALGLAATLAIVSHAVPQQVGDFAVLLHSGYTRRRAFALNVAAGCATLAGALGAYFALADMQQALPTVLAIAAASLLYVAVADLIPSLHRRPEPLETAKQSLLIAAGIGVIAAVHALLAH